MSNVSRISLAVAAAMTLGGELFTFLTLAKPRPTISHPAPEETRRAEEYNVIVGDETPFSPEW